MSEIGIDAGEEGSGRDSTEGKYHPYSLSKLPLRKVIEGTPQAARADTTAQEQLILRRVFDSVDGAAALELLKRMFDHRAAYYPDAGLMQYFEGQRSVVDYIEETIR